MVHTWLIRKSGSSEGIKVLAGIFSVRGSTPLSEGKSIGGPEAPAQSHCP